MKIRYEYHWDPPGWLLIVAAWIFEAVGVSALVAICAQYPARSDVVMTVMMLSIWLLSLVFMTIGTYLVTRFLNKTIHRVYLTIFAVAFQGFASFFLMMVLSVIIHFWAGGSC
jgi:hypothetical protein